VHVGDAGLASASDDEILAAAAGLGAVVVTLDADVHALLAMSRASGPSVLRLRVQGKSAEQIAALVLVAIAAVKADLARGAVATANEAKVRVRRLPLT
jgi:predicted nuclease of predicted toxin-antitoxin system